MVNENFCDQFRKRLNYGRDVKIHFTFDHTKDELDIAEYVVMLYRGVFKRYLELEVQPIDVEDVKAIMGIPEHYKLKSGYFGYASQYRFTDEDED